jgi:hypothetical protein
MIPISKLQQAARKTRALEHGVKGVKGHRRKGRGVVWIPGQGGRDSGMDTITDSDFKAITSSGKPLGCFRASNPQSGSLRGLLNRLSEVAAEVRGHAQID